MGDAARVTALVCMAALALIAFQPPAAHAITGSSIVMYSEQHDYIGAGMRHRLFHSGNARFQVVGPRHELTVYASGGTNAQDFDFTFAAPYGRELAPGVYDNARRMADHGVAGIDISGDGRGCNRTFGRFEVKEIAFDSAGRVARLWVIFEQHCEQTYAPALFGEIRIGMPVDEQPAATAPQILRWPASDMGQPGAVVPATLVAPGDMQVSDVSVAGSNPADFPIRTDDCTGATLRFGQSCQVWLRFNPTAAGVRTALLRMVASDGTASEVELQAFSWGGVTRAVFQSEAGDKIGEGGSWSYSMANARLRPFRSTGDLSFTIVGADGLVWGAQFAAPQGGALTTARYAGATQPPPGTSSPAMYVSNENRSCGTLSGEFTITELRVAPDGTLRAAAVDFVQRCSGYSGALRGSVEFRRGDAAEPPPWMSGSVAGIPSGTPTPVMTPAAELPAPGPDEIPPAPSEGVPSTSVALFTDPDEYVGAGSHRMFDPSNATIFARREVNGVEAVVTTSNGQWFTLNFQAPLGHMLTRGVFDDAMRSAFREWGRPGLEIDGNGRGCNKVAGRFEVKDLEVAEDGTVNRLWVIFEQHCEGGRSALFGEIRINAPAAAGPLATTPAVVRWPGADVGRPNTPVPVTVVARSAAQVTGVSLTGADAAHFAIHENGCAGRLLATGERCQVWVRFSPTAAGTRRAGLVVATSSGTHETVLQGYAWGGGTKLTMTSDDGDWAGQGQDWSYTFANSKIAVAGGRSIIYFSITGFDGTWWDGVFYPGEGDIIALGRYPNARKFLEGGPNPGLEISGNGRAGCGIGEFTLTEARFKPDEGMVSVAVDFVQRCAGATGPALRGTLEWRKGDRTPPAPWMTGRSAGAALPPPPPPPPGERPPDEPAPEDPPAEDPPSESTDSPPSPSDMPADPGFTYTASGPATEQPATEGGADGVPDADEPGGDPEPSQGCEGRAYASDALRRGTASANRIFGRSIADLIRAGAGDDTVFARGGGDCVTGGAGDDRLYGGRGRDVLMGGRGADSLIGGPGADVIDCGRGRRDRAKFDRHDVVRNCERKSRTAPSAPGSG